MLVIELETETIMTIEEEKKNIYIYTKEESNEVLLFLILA